MHTTPEGTDIMQNTTALAAATAHLVDTDQAPATFRARPAETGAGSQQRTRADQPAEDGAREHTDSETSLTYRAVALYLATSVYDEARKTKNPAATLDDISDALPEVLPKVFKNQDTAPAQAATLLPEVTNFVWTFTVIEHARADIGDEYGYVLDILADSLKGGADPKAIRDDVPCVVKKLLDSGIVHRIQEARDEADGPWAEILDIFLNEIREGADPQAVLDRALVLMSQARAPQLTPAQGSLVLDEGLGALRSAAPIESTMRDIDDQRTADENEKTPFLAAEIVQLDWDSLPPVKVDGRWQAGSVDGQFTKVWVHYGTNTADVSREKAREIAREMREFADRLDGLVDRADEIGSSDFTDEARANKA